MLQYFTSCQRHAGHYLDFEVSTVGNSISPIVLPNPTRQRDPMTVTGDKRVNDNCCICRSRYPSRLSAKGEWIRDSKEACIVLSCFVGSNVHSCQRSRIDDDSARDSVGRMIELLLLGLPPRCIRGNATNADDFVARDVPNRLARNLLPAPSPASNCASVLKGIRSHEARSAVGCLDHSEQ